MLNKLDRLSPQPEDDQLVPDISMLSPEGQDRVWELFAKLGNPKDANWAPTMTEEEFVEFEAMLKVLPHIGPHDPDGGPDLDIPRSLQSYWTWSQKAAGWRSYGFHKLKAVQKVRFVEMCRHYGWREGANIKETMWPLSDWAEKDQLEMSALLSAAGRFYPVGWNRGSGGYVAGRPGHRFGFREAADDRNVRNT